jgi:predicted SnoaL-like aldol condensation-catalyzing enzyme
MEHTGIAVVHLFRFEGDKIAEFWDVAQILPDPAPNENGPL